VNRYLLLLALATSLACAAEPLPVLDVPPGARFINGTGQLPLLGHTFKAPGFTCQGYIEICEAAGPQVWFIGWNNSEAPLTMRLAYKTAITGTPARVTFAVRNRQLGLTNAPEETVVAPGQFYTTDPVALSVKAKTKLYLRSHVKLDKDLQIGCGGFAPFNDPRPDGRWSWGVYTGADDRTLDPDLETQWKPNFEGLFVPFLMVGENVNPKARFVVALGDSLTFQNGPDEGGVWFQRAFPDVPHCNTAIGGDALSNVVSPEGEIKDKVNRARFAVLQHATDVINFYGHNDLGNGVTAEALLHLDAKVCARPEIAKARKWRCTLTPFTHNKPGVDVAQLTEADQTPDKTSPVIIAYNKEIRAQFKKYGYDGIIDVGSVLATGPDSLYWKPGMAGDGTHFGRAPAGDLIVPEARKILTSP
jgi:lysophospholipase L1-like esterase